MTTTIISTDTITTGTAYSANGDDELIVFEGINLMSEDSVAVLAAGGNNEALIAGNVIGYDTALSMGTHVFDTDISITILSTGSVASLTGNGIDIVGVNNSIINAGEITGAIGVKFLGTVENLTISNSGSILSEEAGIYGPASLGARISNTGLISDGEKAGISINLAEFGVVKGGIVIKGDDVVIANSGEIIGSTSISYGIAIAGDNASITNSGLIQSNSTDASRAAVDLVTDIGDTAFVGNSDTGQIVSAVTAIEGGAGEETIVNAGFIGGDVILHDGDDILQNTGSGQVSGNVLGGIGNDTLIGGSLDDRFNGGDNADRLVGNDGNDNLLGGGSGDVIRGGDGNDFIDGEGGVDDVRGGNGADEVLGGIGDDTVRGGAGDDIVDGGKGDDDVRGGSGDDDVIGGLNKDQLFGGSGRDVFIFREEADSTNDSNRDFIKDFDIGEDLIDLSLLPGVLTFVGSSGFSGTAREVRVVENSAGNSVIYVDVDGDGTGDMRIIAEGVTGLSESDFLL